MNLEAFDELAPAPRPVERTSNANEQKVRMARAQVQNLKDFSAPSVNQQPMTILLGPGIPRKSTIVGMFRAPSLALRMATWRKPEILHFADGNGRGHQDTAEDIPSPLEDRQHKHSDEDAVDTFTLSSGTRRRTDPPRSTGVPGARGLGAQDRRGELSSWRVDAHEHSLCRLPIGMSPVPSRRVAWGYAERR